MKSFTGFIKLHRGIMNWEWYENANVMRVFLHCLLSANYEQKSWQGVAIARGSFVTSYSQLSSDLKLTIRQIRTCIKYLQTTGELTYESTSRYSTIIVNNYDSYQSNDTQSDTVDDTQEGNQTTIKRQSNDNQTTTTKKVKKEKNNKKEKKLITIKSLFHKLLSTDEDLKEFENLKTIFEQWLDYKDEIKKQYKGEIGLKNAFKEFAELASGDEVSAQKLVSHAIAKGWQGIYPIKESQSMKNTAVGIQPSTDWEGRSL